MLRSIVGSGIVRGAYFSFFTKAFYNHPLLKLFLGCRQLQGQVTKEWNQSSHWEQTVFLAAMREMAGAGAVDA
jgi:hypothetical protein